MSRGRLATLVGAAEAEDMIFNEECPTKQSAKGRTLYFYMEEKEMREARKIRSYAAKQGPVRLRNKECEQALENFEDASLMPVSFEDLAPASSCLKRPAAAMALEDDDEGSFKRPAAAKATKVKATKLEQGYITLKSLLTSVPKLKTKALVAKQKMRHPKVAKVCKPLVDEITIVCSDLDNVYKEGQTLLVRNLI